MAFFQNSVINKYIKALDKKTVSSAYSKFREHFHNQAIQENIRNSKEEQYQGEFLIDLFVNVLGYTKNPTPNFNLTTEYKNLKDSKKADGAIVIKDVVKVVIELKGTNTTDLNKIETQAFGYKNNQPECEYIITSNFEKLRFYIDNAIEYLEFNLFTLTEKEFELLYVCLAFENIEKGLPKKIKSESVSHEDVITKKLYNDYSVFKKELYHNLVELNPQYEALELFKISQKLLDRFLFIFFAEDRQLLPTNLIYRINKEWRQLKEMRIEVSLYDRYKIYFNDLNIGAKVSLPAFTETVAAQKEEFQIFAYNGGLFQSDELLNSIKIADDILFRHTDILSNYDFSSEVDVNILGHIFENSLNELDELKAKVEGQEIEKTKTKRKKDGVFYTPKYITKYIVENTVGRLCQEKKAELKINDEDYFTDKKRQKATKLALSDKLTQYRNWLLELTICDPACGSGAFLNQALDFLISEHRYIDELYAKLFGDAIVLSDIEKSILENNLFGVDINEESVEIAKLSLWLRTAQPYRKLNDLNDNIKCGNSLINDATIAGVKAFNWQKEFFKIFVNGGFDVVVGNPPYVRVQNLSNDDVDFYFSEYKAPTGKIDLSILFFEKAFTLINPNGVISFVSSSQWMQTDYGKNIRKIILENRLLDEIIDFGTLPVFQGVSTYPAIFSFSKKNKEDFEFKCILKKEHLNIETLNSTIGSSVDYNSISDSAWDFGGFNLVAHLKKCKIKWEKLSHYGKAYYGVVTGLDNAFIVTNEIVSSENLEMEIIKPYAYKGEEVNRYEITKPSQLTIYPYKRLENGDSGLLTEEELMTNYPNIYKYLSKFRTELEKRKDSRKLYATGENWFRNVRQGNFNLIEAEKIQIRGIGKNVLAGLLSKDSCFSGANCPAIILNDDTLSIYCCLALLNSSLITYYLNGVCPKKLGGYIRYNTKNISLTPILLFDKKTEIEIVQLVTSMIKNFETFAQINNAFKKYLISQVSIEGLTDKLQNWYKLDFGTFILELNKIIKKSNGQKLSKVMEMEWMQVFENKKAEAQKIGIEINKIDKEINQRVYKLYDLTEEDIKIVEGNW